MKDKDKTKEQVISEPEKTRQRAAKSKGAVSDLNQNVGSHRYMEIIETMKDGLVIITPEGIIEEINEFFTIMTGWTRKDLVGTKVPFKF